MPVWIKHCKRYIYKNENIKNYILKWPRMKANSKAGTKFARK